VAIYAIGDIQGCYDELRRLLDKIAFDPANDRLWFCGDLVNRGPASLESLRFVKSLGDSALTVLGNHDLHLLALHHGVRKIRDTDNLDTILQSPDRDELMQWLQTRPLIHRDKAHKAVLVHAGIHPDWTLGKARKLAAEVEAQLQAQPQKLFRKMYGNGPSQWSDELVGSKRTRCIINVFTRMRYFRRNGNFDFNAAGSPRQHKTLIPWFDRELSVKPAYRILFGHWSTLQVGCYGRCFALDGGCVWGGQLVALRIDNDAEDWFFIDSGTRKPIESAN
jgi:bis(5'-nucleosyl)-tetraphosphatase (symmetrical)